MPKVSCVTKGNQVFFCTSDVCETCRTLVSEELFLSAKLFHKKNIKFQVSGCVVANILWNAH